MKLPEQQTKGDVPPRIPERRRRGRPLRTYALVLSFIVAGVLAWNGLTATMTWTNTQRFCLSCHEMVVNPYAEFKDTIHDRNAAGVHATCADCHVPQELWPKVVKKVRATSDLYHHLLGTVDTPEKYDARRLYMAQAVWDYMKSSDSRECRSCHTLENMALDEQNGRAARKHETMDTGDSTCIDCHRGIAHSLPDGYEAESS